MLPFNIDSYHPDAYMGNGLDDPPAEFVRMWELEQATITASTPEEFSCEPEGVLDRGDFRRAVDLPADPPSNRQDFLVTTTPLECTSAWPTSAGRWP